MILETPLRCLAALVILLALSHSAVGEDREAARKYFKTGIQHYDLAEYKEALTAFKDAYRSFDDPAILFNIGQCYRQLGDKEQAIRFYRMFLIKVPEADNADEVRRLIVQLQSAITAEHAAQTQPPIGTAGELGRLVPPAPSSRTTVSKAPAPAAALAVTPAPPRPAAQEPAPLYRRWWLWTAVGVAAAGLGVGLGLGLAPPRDPTPSMGAVRGN